ncbi:MAG: hypothetical protein C7B46_19475 [Sulfobacillus benefaciens]|uniref:Uncharacterized protein n=1 Tax=Sulfobacillus benefaciens TaxID=453960 RepID=A0A2T2WYT7_9FIRM|nr:MAG: hypothetical protein C7B46_19475 [Sulfobacillus benefaciens]
MPQLRYDHAIATCLMSFVLLWIVCSLLALGISHFLPLRDLPATLVGDHWAHWVAGYWAAFFGYPGFVMDQPLRESSGFLLIAADPR